MDTNTSQKGQNDQNGQIDHFLKCERVFNLYPLTATHSPGM